jgi:hypothetical protein
VRAGNKHDLELSISCANHACGAGRFCRRCLVNGLIVMWELSQFGSPEPSYFDRADVGADSAAYS